MWTAVGIEEIDERVYRALLKDPALDVAECARTLDIPASDCVAAIGRLIAAGLLEESPPNGGARTGTASVPSRDRPRPVDPRAALGALIRARRGELDRLATDVDRLATDFYLGRLRADPEMLIDVVEGTAAITARFRDLLSSAERDIVRLDAPPYVVLMKEADPLVDTVLRRGVRFRSLHPTEVLNDPVRFACTTAMTQAGGQARFLRTVPIKLFLVDGRTAMLPLTASEDGRRCRMIMVQRSALTDALYALFEVLWRQAAAVPTAPPAAPRNGTDRSSSGNGQPALSDEEQSVLRHLVTGMKDEAIARQLGCSRRTLRRRVDGLLDKLGATSRFQAGAVAAQRGWL